MGANPSCEDLKNTDNPCEIGKCINDMIVLEKTSESLARMAVLHFKAGTNYNEKPVKSAFLKIFAKPNFEKNFNVLEQYYSELWNLRELDEGKLKYITQKTKTFDTDSSAIYYELEIYKNVIMPLIDYNICPNYVSCYATSTSCTFYDIAVLLDNGHLKKIVENRDSIFQTMAFNLLYSLYDQKKKYKIDHTSIPKKERQNYGPITDVIFSFIILEAISKNSITFLDYLQTNIRNISEIQKILFQVVCACYGLFLSETNHNDLHPGNIYLEKHNEPVTLHYNINGIIYTLHTNYFVKMFDYDRSYCTYIGDNPYIADIINEEGLIEKNNMYHFGEENSLSEMRDVWKIVFAVDRMGLDLLKYISKDRIALKEIKKLNSEMNTYFFQDYAENRSIFDSDLDRLCCSIPETLNRIARDLKLKDEYKEGIVYNLDKKLFNHGILNVEKLQNRLLEPIKIDDEFAELDKQFQTELDFLKNLSTNK